MGARAVGGVVSLFFVMGCSTNLTPPSGTQVSCLSDEDCPANWLCRQSDNLCFDPRATDNLPPNLVAGGVMVLPRPVAVVNVPITVSDPNADLVADHRVTVTARYSVDGTQWFSALANPTLSDLEVSAQGTALAFTWDLLASAADGSGPLTAVQLDDGTMTIDAVGFLGQAQLELQATDSEGAIGEAVVLGPFDVGNDPPEVGISVAPAVAGAVNVLLTLTDSSSDASDIEVEFNTDSGPWNEATPVIDTRQGLPTTPAGRAHVFVWDSIAPPPGGVGLTRQPSTRIRIRAVDELGHYSPWVETPPFEIGNQTPPRVATARALRAELAAGTSPVSVVYTLVDDESDPVDVTIQYSFDLGSTWTDCLEYPHPASEGRTSLLTSPVDFSGAGGVTHIFFWDPTGLVVADSTSTLLRLLAADGAVGAELVVPLVNSAGPPASTGDVVVDTQAYTLGVSGSAGDAIGSGDFTGDGVLDLIVANRIEEEIQVLPGTGGGAFGTLIITSALPFPDSLVVQDFDSDGVLDVAVGNVGTASDINVYTGDVDGMMNADGTFTLADTIAGVEARHLGAGLFSNDAVPDLVGSDFTAISVEFHFGSGTGTFPTTQSVAVTDGVLGFLVAELTGDSFDDVVVTHQSGLTVLVPDGGGTITPNFLPLGDFNAVAAADFDRDGMLDLATVETTSPGERALTLLVNEGGGSFARDISVPVAGGVVHVAAPDFNGDGTPDLIAQTTSPQRADILVTSLDDAGNPVTFARALSVPPQGVLNRNHPVDLDADGDIDLAQLEQRAINVSLLALDKLPGPDRVSAERPRPSPVRATIARAADFNGDGVVDIMVGGTGELYLLPGETTAGLWTGSFEDPVAIPLPADFDVLEVADFNQDGALDLILGGDSPDEVRVLEHISDGAAPTGLFAALNPIPTPGNVLALVAGDVTDDGVVDVVVATDSLDRIYALIGNGDSTFSEAASVTAEADLLRIADVNNDGLIDVIASKGDNKFLVGAGDGTFAPPVTDLGGDFAYMVPADFDQDGLVDIAANDSSASYMLLNQGSVTFENIDEDTPFAVGGQIPTLGDLNLDGLPDIMGTRAGFVDYALTGAIDGPDAGFVSVVSGFEASTTVGNIFARGDYNHDGMADFIVSDAVQDLVTFRFGQREHLAGRWSRPLRATTVSPFDAQIFGSGFDGSTSLAMHVLTVDDERRSDGSVGVGNAPGFERILWETGVSDAQLLPLTLAYRAHGDVQFTRVLSPDGSGALRTRVDCRLGSETGTGKDGLSLGGSTPPCRHTADPGPAGERGVIITLPLLSSRNATNLVTETIRVFRRELDWVRANEVPSDPLSGVSDASDYLPIRVDGASTRSVVHRRMQWTEIPEGPFSSPAGARFRVNESARTVDILTDRLGDFQVFFEAP